MKIGILVCGHAIEEVAQNYGDYAHWFEALLDGNGFTYQHYNVDEMKFPQSIDDADGWLITGSRHGVYEEHAFIPPLEDFIRKAYAAPVPMVGVCFGHQIIAQALGGSVEKYDQGWAVGRQDYKFEGHGNVALNAWHQDQVMQVPDGARVIAGNDFCENAALVYGDSILTMQPHPEFTNPIMAEYIDLRRDPSIYDPDMMNRAATNAKTPNDGAVLARDIAKFFLQAREVPL